MRVVLKLKNTEFYFSGDTKTGLTKSPSKAVNCNVVKILKNTPELLQLFEFYQILRRGETPTRLINPDKAEYKKPRIDYNPLPK